MKTTGRTKRVGVDHDLAGTHITSQGGRNCKDLTRERKEKGAAMITQNTRARTGRLK
jgi:hypothetical protein